MTHVKTDTQLAYYLQGFFEIAGTTDLNENQAKKILAIILKMDQKGPVAQMAVDNLVADECLTIVTNTNVAGAHISAQLNEIFHHDIDPSYAGDQSTFQNIHDGQSNDGNTPPKPRPHTLARC